MPRILRLGRNAAADTAQIAAFRGAGFEVDCAEPTMAAVAAAAPDLVIWQSEGDHALLKALRAQGSPFADLPLVMLLPKDDRNSLIAARLEGADDALPAQTDIGYLLAVAASRLAQVNRVRAAARAPTEPMTANRNQFSQRAMDSLRKAGPDGKLALRLVEVDGSRRDAGEVVGALRTVAHDGQTATRVADNRYAVLTEADRGMEQVAQQLEAQISSVAITPGAMNDNDVMKAMAMTLRQFGSRGASGGVMPTLDRAFTQMVEEAKVKMKGLREAMDRRAFRLFYQPIVRLGDGSAHHYEALVRFNSAELKNTGEVIAFAEQAGLIGQFDLAVLDLALAMINSSQIPPDAKIAVNLSGQTVQHAAAMQPILDRLNSRKALAPRLQFELTESAEIGDLKAADDIVQQIRFPGFKVFLDDFGAGAASFQYLHALKVDGVKIDGRYVRSLPESTKDAALLRGLVRLAQDLKLATVAECVETAPQAKLLAEMGVEFGQGWHFGKPDPAIQRPTTKAA